MVKKCAVIGGGSWGTALVKVLHEKHAGIYWYMRNASQAETIRKTGRNPRYLSFLTLDPEKLIISTDLDQTVREAEIIILAIPSAFIAKVLQEASVDFTGKIVVSAVKGIIPGPYKIMGDWLHQEYRIDMNDFVVITGPGHSEEVGMKKLTYLTFAGQDPDNTREIANLFEGEYLIPVISDDIYGTEYAATLKNIYALAAGIAHGIGYGDNYLAVLIANAAQEMKKFLDKINPIERDIKRSAYLGDLLVTAYSQFSRNRTLGTMIGKGYPVQSALIELNQVAEGYYATQGVINILSSWQFSLPIIESVHRILYKGISPIVEFIALSKHLK